MSFTKHEVGNNTKQLLKALKFLNENEIEVGIFEGNFKDGDDLTVYGKAVVNEYGARIKVTEKMRAYLHYKGIHLNPETMYINIPERSFIRSSFDSNEKTIDKAIEDMLGDIFEGKLTAEEFISIIGENSIRMIREYIQKGISPSNSPITLENKKGNKPLIDTTELINSIDWRVVKK